MTTPRPNKGPRPRWPHCNLWAITRHPTVSLEAVQHAAGVHSHADNWLATIANGSNGPNAAKPSVRLRVAAAIRALGVPAPGANDEERAAWWFAPMSPERVRMFARQQRRPNRLGGASNRTHFVPFTEALVGARCWDHWKRSTRMALHDEVVAHFALHADPFDKPRVEAQMWRSAPLDACAKQLRSCITRGQYALVLGASGSGKSLLARQVLQSMAPRIIVSRRRAPDTSRISEYSLVAGMLLDFADALGQDMKAPPHTEMAMRRLAMLVGKARQHGRMPVAVIEEAHAVPGFIKRLVKRIMEGLADGYEDRLAVVMLGQTDTSAEFGGGPAGRARSLEMDLADPDEREWTQRVVPIRVPPLGRTLTGYVGHRLGAVGGDPDKVLGDGWREALTRALPGDRLVPLAVDHLLSQAMSLAFRLEDKRVTGRHIDEAATTTPRTRES